MKYSLDWFIDRIGKRIYRKETSCKCDTCREVYENGIVVHDDDHAYHLELVQHELNIDYYNKPL